MLYAYDNVSVSGIPDPGTWKTCVYHSYPQRLPYVQWLGTSLPISHTLTKAHTYRP